jgi:hypothetical protein
MNYTLFHKAEQVLEQRCWLRSKAESSVTCLVHTKDAAAFLI